ncbi:GmrSD restriction endonuclease domain-containing protein [Micromonospora sp. DT229]|uniref:GmrSD restriction endonuclease domain-containing protein n=1 Tax=Micromonospora sp. DT229 TaxID=3393430 RepID=UPI003CF71E68
MSDAPIRGDGFTIHTLFTQFQFKLDPYQREYSWGRKDVKALLDDLTSHFRLEWKPGHERKAARHYRPYFLGPFVYYQDDDLAALVDGQQRITTLHLLLIHLRRLALEAERPEYRNDINALEPLIAGTSYGERAYAIRSPERAALLEMIYDDKPVTLSADSAPSVANLYERSQEIVELLPDYIRDEALPLFIHWLLNRVCLVGINANDRQQGWEIFETMNDRGVQLGPADLLKSFLLRRARNDDNLPRLGNAWTKMLVTLGASDAQAPTKFFQAMLIGRYAEDLEEAGNIGVSFHGWVQDNAVRRMGLRYAPDFARFIERDLVLLADRFSTLSAATQVFEPGLEAVFYNARNELVQMPFLLAAVQPDDTAVQFREKIRLVSGFLDLVYVRMIVNNKFRKPDNLYRELFPLIMELRKARDIDELSKVLGRRVAELDVDFTAVRLFGLRPDNLAQVRYLLARLTAFVEVECGQPNEIERFLSKKEPFEVEHIWADKFERYQSEVRTEANFRSQRNRFGALLLLRKSHNASYQDAPFEDKVEWYRGQNHLAASLHPVTYQRNKPFTDGVVRKHRLEKLLHSVARFDQAAIELRQRLYERLCEIIWNPGRLGITLPPSSEVAVLPASKAAARRTRAHFGGVTTARLVEVGALVAAEKLTLTYKKAKYTALVNSDGQIELDSGEKFESPSPAASAATGKPAINGWSAWKVQRQGKSVSLFDIRSDALARGLLEGPS